MDRDRQGAALNVAPKEGCIIKAAWNSCSAETQRKPMR